MPSLKIEEANLKNGKKPTASQKKIMQLHGLNVDNFLIVKNLPDYIEIVKVSDLKKHEEKIKTRKLQKKV